MFDDAPYGVLRGESSAFYLHDFAAHTRIRDLVPRARLIAILRDPVDRAYSNWLHLWADGLEPIGDFVRAFEAETERVDAGWGFFWEYRGLGLYGRQLQHLFQVFPRNQVLLLRYRELIDHPNVTLQRIHLFLGVTPDPVVSIPQQNSRSYSPPSARHAALGALVRSGARVGAHLPPSWWRKGSAPVLRLLQHDAQRRPALSSEQREYLIRAFADDIALLEAVTSASYSDWLRPIDRGDFATRTRERADVVSVS